MSDPVANVEIEDVLSSIRRLVSNTSEASDEQKKAPETAASPEHEPPAKPVEASMGRLVLTPSLRVDSAEDTPEASASEDEADLPVDLGDASSLRYVSDLAADGEEAPFIEAEDEGDGQSAEVTDLLGSEAHHDATEEAKADTADAPEIDMDAGPSPEDAQAMAEAAEEDAPSINADKAWDAPEGALQARIAELEAAVATRNEDWEPDGTTSEAYSGGPMDALPWEDFDGSDEAASGPLGPEADKPEPMADPAPLGEDVLKETQEASESAESAQPAPETDDGSETDDGLGAEAEAVLDEETLRDLVAEIVRDELQGALGERITRNVRKLVRREIHRAMAIQDLE